MISSRSKKPKVGREAVATVVTNGKESRIRQMSPVAERLTGWTECLIAEFRQLDVD